jgi:nitrate reductase gamma subunit
MNGLFLFLEVIFPYIAIVIFVVGSIYRLWQWLKRPVPLRVNLAPAKTTWAGVTGKIAAEVLVFISLFRNDKVLWVSAWVMHACGLIVIIGSHFLGVVDSSLELYAGYSLPAVKTIIYVAALFSFPLIAALLFLLIKRLVTREVRIISLATDYLALGLILAHVGNGVYMSFFTELNMAEVTKWGLGLFTFQPYLVQGSWIFGLHCLTGFGLFLYFPFSKLFHPLGQVVNRWTLTQKEQPLIEKGAVVK